jgi:hypothetical protein
MNFIKSPSSFMVWTTANNLSKWSSIPVNIILACFFLRCDNIVVRLLVRGETQMLQNKPKGVGDIQNCPAHILEL